MSHRLSPAQIHDAVTRVRQGADLHGVARALGVHRATLGKWVRAAAIDAGEPVRKGRELPKRPSRPAPSVGEVSWMDSGNCVAWPDFTDMDVRQQMRICWDGCRVRDECREFGLETIDLVGADGRPAAGIVYGGLSPRDLGRLYRLRREEAVKADKLRAEVSA